MNDRTHDDPPRRKLLVQLSWLALAAALPWPAAAHGDAAHKARPNDAPPDPTQHDWGRAGDPRRVQRTVGIAMSDRMRFTPARLQVRTGQTLRLRVHNRGRAMHELVLGTRVELERHAELMKKHPGMEHDEPFMAHVPSGRRADIVWHFNRPGDFMFGCLVPGHWEAGMVGHIQVKD